MPLRRTSLILPCRRLDDFPTHLAGSMAAELLTGWTALWHPSLISVTGSLPHWLPADELPDPSALEGELVVIPSVSRQRLASDWCDRLRATAPLNLPPVESVASRSKTIAAILGAASLEASQASPDVAADFLALGYAYLQVELLTRAMHYTTVLDSEQFTNAVVAAARAAVNGENQTTTEELARAFDLLADARNHVYSVDFYIVDITLLAESTLGESLRAKLSLNSPTNVLATGELIEQMAREQPDTLAALKRSIEAGMASVVGGQYNAALSVVQSPESLLAGINRGRESAKEQLGKSWDVFAQFESTFSTLLPEVLRGTGFQGALHAAFDGGRSPHSEQAKTNWGPGEGALIQALAETPLDAARPETWLKFAQTLADSIAHDHVATVLLASWPGTESEFFDDLRRAARYNSVLGKIVTLDEYFRTTREADDWTCINPREYPGPIGTEFGPNPISSRVDAYRQDVLDAHDALSTGLMRAAGLASSDSANKQQTRIVAVNPWNHAGTQFVGVDPLDFDDPGCARGEVQLPPSILPDVPGCGFAMIEPATDQSPVALAEGFTLRNELLELTVSETTGGIQSLRTHRDRSTRVSQRLIFHQPTLGHRSPDEAPSLDTQMVADRVEITRNDSVLGEITSYGRLLDANSQLLARFTQAVRAVRGLPAMLVDVRLEPEKLPEGDIWSSYFASRLAFSSDAVAVRRGMQWQALETTRQCIESSEWIEFDDGFATATVFALGLPFHRRAATTWLDTLLLAAGEQRRRFQFAIGLDQTLSAKSALSLLTAGKPRIAHLATPLGTSRGWFLHVAATNVLITHVEPLDAPAPGIRLRLLETEGRETHTTVAAFRPFQAARITDFRGNSTGVLSVVDGAAELDIGPHRWIQVEAEW